MVRELSNIRVEPRELVETESFQTFGQRRHCSRAVLSEQNPKDPARSEVVR
jgi:hypothetical protein